MKHVVVTGGTSGIGRSVAAYFAGRGDRVTIIGGRDDGASVAAEFAANVTFKQVNVADEAQVKAWFAGIDALDVPVNAAGIYIGNDGKGLLNLKAEDFESEWRVNTFGTFLICKYAMPVLQKSKGNIVNISSISGMQPDAFSLGYASSKAAVSALTKCLALAYVNEVRVNAVCPGPIETPMLYRSFGGKLEGNLDYEAWIADNPSKRYGQVEDVVKAVAYLADPENTYVTGSLLTVDGGWTAKAL